ncbi:TetR/AcrR family transcriptional regulator [Lichenicoccus sp.]|uniref:TetR/AcrR family transcriptional regulator n=1 Tax=Lichenicoccus sp. TaxID=2781899 RepID=UPI003D124987
MAISETGGPAPKGSTQAPAKPRRSYVISLDNRKARGSGHERPQEILAAARELFLEHGVERVSTRQIASRVGMSQTALYVYFKSKEEMLDALVDAAFAKLGAAFRRLGKPADPVAILRLAIAGYIRFGLNNPDEYRIAFLLRDGRRAAAQASGKRQYTTGMQVFGMLEAMVSECAALGAIRPAGEDAKGTAQVLWAAVHGLVALMLAYPDFGWEATDRLIALHTDMLLDGLLQPGPLASCQPTSRGS